MMNYEQVKQSISSLVKNDEKAFSVLRDISHFVNQKETEHKGRDLVIRALSVQDKFKEEDREILAAMVRSVGLFPYMKEFIKTVDFEDYLAFEMHRANLLGDDIIFHSLQSRIFNLLLSGQNVVLSASTSVGKSLVIDALIASKKYKNMVIVVPTIALIDEIRRRLAKRFEERCHIITHPSQVRRTDRPNIFILTQERVLVRDDLNDIDLFVVDEFYKVNLQDGKPSDRAVDLNLAFHKLAKTESQFYLLGPNIETIKGLDKYEQYFIPSEFSTVAVDTTHFSLPTNGDQRKEKLVDLCNEVDGPTIIYCQSPGRAAEVADYILKNTELPDNAHVKDAVEWIGENYSADWIIAQSLAKGIGVHHGGVPRALQQYFIKLFNERKIRFLICTATIIEGVNTVAKNVIIYDRRKSKNVLDHFTYKNIEGRAGRMSEYFIGKVFVLEEPPVDETYAVEFPIGNQGPNTPFDLLLELPADDLAEISKRRLEGLFENSILSAKTLRQNRHVPIDDQENVARNVLDYVEDETLEWSGMPTAAQMQTLCSILFDHLENHLLKDYNIHSGSQLAWHLNALRAGRDLSRYVKACIETRQDKHSISQAVEVALKFIRNVVCHRLPRDIMAIEAIQNEVYGKLGKRKGSYGTFVTALENLFLPSNLFALDEYGIPIQTAQKLPQQFQDQETLDGLLQELKRVDLDTLEISIFEKKLLEDVRFYF